MRQKRFLAILISLALVVGDAPLFARAAETGQESVSVSMNADENEDGETPPAEDGDTSSSENGDTPPAENGDTPPAENGDTSSSENGDTPPAGEQKQPVEEEQEQVSGNDTDTVSENDVSTVSENTLESVSENDLDAEREVMIQEAQEAFTVLASDKPLMALLYHADSYDARSKADVNSGTMATLEIGQTLYIQSVAITEDDVWYQAQYLLNGAEGSGYVQSYFWLIPMRTGLHGRRNICFPFWKPVPIPMKIRHMECAVIP